MEIIKSDYIRNKLSYVESKVRNDTKQKLYDINTTAEYIFMNILNDVYGWQLINANNEKENFPAIDLIDKVNKMVIQVTSETTSNKVRKETIEKFQKLIKTDKYKEYANYKIKMFYIKNKPNFSDKILKEFKEKGMIISDFLGIEDINTKVSSEPKIATKVFETLCDIFHDNICNSPQLNPNLTTKSSINDSSFIGREGELKAIDEMLENSNSLLLINGIGGIGKSSLANHYLYTREKGFDYYGFIEGLDTFISEFRNSLDLKAEKEEELYREIISKLQGLKGDKLLVIDNVEDMESHKELMEMILSLEKYDYKILFTSRRKIKKVKSYPLGTLLPKDAQKLFLSYFETKETEKVDKIIEYLGLHTLFIKLVAETVENEGYSLDDILEKFEDENGGLSKIDYIDEESGEEVTFNQNLQELFSMQNLKDEYVLLLKRLSVFPSIDIELSFLEEILGKERLKGRLNFLVGRGWLIENDGSYKLHQIIKEYICSAHLSMFKEIEVVLSSYNELLKNSADIQIALEHRENIIYFESLQMMLEKIGEGSESVALFLDRFATVYRYLDEYEKAKPLYLKAIEIRKEILGENHSRIVPYYNNLASLYKLMGEYKKAELLYLKTIKIGEEFLGKKDLIVVVSYNNLAGLYHLMGTYKKAEILYLKAIKIWEEILGKNHSETATSYNNLAELYRAMGANEKAKTLHLKSIEILEEVSGEKHPNTAMSYNNLAGLYKSMKEYEKAELLYLKTIKIREEVLGKNHSSTATSYNDLAGLHNLMGEYEKVEPLYLKAIEINEKVLGEKHPETATCYYNLAGFYYQKNELKKAYGFMQKTVEIEEKVLPENHPNLIASKQWLSMIEQKLK